MSTQVQFRHGDTASLAGVTPALGEIGSDSTKKVVIVGDGSTPGGIPMAREDAVALKLDADDPMLTEFARLFAGFKTGMVLSNNTGDTANDIDISPGVRADDSSSPKLLRLTSAITKRLDAVWSAGSGGGALDTGTKTNGATYAWYVIGGDSVATDVIATASFGAPSLPAGYTRKRYIGTTAVSRVSGSNLLFTQIGNFFRYASYGAYLTTTTVNSTAASLITLPEAPAGASFLLHLRGRTINATVNGAVLLRNPSDADVAPAFNAVPLPSIGGIGVNTTFIGEKMVFSNSAKQVAARAVNDTTTLDLTVLGWEDPYL